MFGELLLILGIFLVGFTVGYGVRETISRRRRHRKSAPKIAI
jgi:hypothetical protein